EVLPSPETEPRLEPRPEPRVELEHDPEKACPGLDPGWVPVFGERSCSTNKLKRDDDSKKSHPALGDLRFRALMSEEAWASLPLAIRHRFSKRLAAGQTIVYAGEILESRMSRAGWWLAQAARLIGAPLPLTRDIADRSARVPAVHLA